MNRNDPAPSIWLVRDLPRKIAKGSVTRDSIAAAAVDLLDETGVGGFTMREIGRRLGVSAMACYAHVRHKDDVLELAQDRVMGRIVVGEGTWQTILRGLADDYRVLLVAHSWLPQLAGRFLNAGPNTAAMSRAAADGLAAAGLPADVVPQALSAVFTLAHGHGAVEAAWRTRLTGSALDDLTGRLAQQSSDPVLARRAEMGPGLSAQEDWDFALDCLVAGIAGRTGDPR